MTDISRVGQDFLAHYGVLGMKWGVRKDDSDRPVSKSQQIRRDRKIARGEMKDVNRKLNDAVRTLRIAERTGTPEEIAAARKAVNEADENYGETYSRSVQTTLGENIAAATLLAGGIFLMTKRGMRVSDFLTQQTKNGVQSIVRRRAARAATEAAARAGRERFLAIADRPVYTLRQDANGVFRW